MLIGSTGIPAPWDPELPRLGGRREAGEEEGTRCAPHKIEAHQTPRLLLASLESSRGVSHPPPFQKLGNSFHYYFFFLKSSSSSWINSSFLFLLFFFPFLFFFFLPPLRSLFFFFFYCFLLLSAKLQKLCFENCCPRVQLLSCPVSIVLMLIPYVCHIGAVPSSSSSSPFPQSMHLIFFPS